MATKNKQGALVDIQEGFAECRAKCASSEHAQMLNIAITKSRPEEEIIAWVARHCYAPGRSRDLMGRYVLHIAASCGRTDLCNWLLTYKGASLNGRDKESGYTSLHRAILYGQIQTAIFFIKQGANLALTDNNGYTALDLIQMDKPPHVQLTKTAPLETYVWGNNSNYNLGTGDNTTKNNPDILDFFRKQNISIKKVALQKFHSGFLSSSGNVYTCRHGRGGRLGIGSETILLAPKSVQIGACMDIALGVDHTVFLAQSGLVYTCGENTYHQLGQEPPPCRLLAPGPVGTRVQAKGVAAARYHSVFWTDDSVYTWGLNAGQLGHIKGDKTVILPRRVTSFEIKNIKISQIAVSDGATVICTSKGDVIALHGYKSKKIGVKQHGIQNIQVTGGNLDPAVDPGGSAEIDFKLVAGGGAPLQIFILRLGQVLVWSEGKDKSFLVCSLQINKPQPNIGDISVYRGGLMLVTDDGEVWQGSIANTPTSQQSQGGRTNLQQLPGGRATSPSQQHDRFQPGKNVFNKDPALGLKVKRISTIHRAVLASADPKGRNFCVLQVSPREALTELPEVGASSMAKDLENLYTEVSEDDTVHDVVCVLQGKRFPAHSAILAAGSDYLSKKLKYAEDEDVPMILELHNVHPVIFSQILQYLYTKTCSLLQEGPCSVSVTCENCEEDPDSNSKSPSDSRSDLNIVENTKKMAELELNIDDNPATVSAYAVYEKNRKKKAKDLKRAESEKNERKRRMNPLYLFQEAAKNLGVYGVAKIVDCFRYHEGSIYQRSTPKKPSIEFSLQNLVDLADVTLVTEDGVELYAHKSILVARSEYFSAMLTSGWMESGHNSHLNLMMKSCYLEAILEYLYRDTSRTLSKSEDVEFISNLLVHADQLLLSRLKEQCETELAQLITLRNVAEMLEFTFIYLADQLKRSCLQFVVLNLGFLLETQALDRLEPEVLAALDDYYRETNEGVSRRKITAYEGYPSAEEIETEFGCHPLTLDELVEYEDKKLAAGKPRTRRHSSGEKKKSPKLRARTSSIMSSSAGSSASDSEVEDPQDLSLDMDNMSIIDFHIEEKEERSPQPGEENNKGDTSSTQVRDTSYFSNLLSGSSFTKSDDSAAQVDHDKEGSPAGSTSPKKAGSPPKKVPGETHQSHAEPDVEGVGAGSSKSPWKIPQSTSETSSVFLSSGTPQESESQRKDCKSRKFPKMSQKERKKLSEQQGKSSSSDITPSPTAAVKSWTGWCQQQTDMQPQISLSDIMNRQKNEGKSPSAAVGEQLATAAETGGKQRRTSESGEGKQSRRSTWKQVDLSGGLDLKSVQSSENITSPSKQPGNPWKMTRETTPTSPTGVASILEQELNTSFQEIMEQDAKEERTLVQNQSKPLHILQLEEQAMMEFQQLYSLQYPDEEITVSRVEESKSAKPVWNYRIAN